PRCGDLLRGSVASKATAEIRLKPSAHPFLVVPPRLTKYSVQLSFFAPDHEIHQGKVNRGSENRRWRLEEQGRAKEDKHVSSEVERIPRKKIWGRRDELVLGFEGNHTHLVCVKMEGRPHTYQKPQYDKHPPRQLQESRSKRGNSEQ